MTIDVRGTVVMAGMLVFRMQAEEMEDFDFDDFDVVINGLDNLKARMWVGERLMSMVQFAADGTPDPSSVVPLVDGGTEGYDGQIHVVVPYVCIGGMCLRARDFKQLGNTKV